MKGGLWSDVFFNMNRERVRKRVRITGMRWRWWDMEGLEVPESEKKKPKGGSIEQRVYACM